MTEPAELPVLTEREASDVVAAWFDEHVDTIHRYVARRIGETAARDVVADTFRIAIEQFGRFDGRPGGERPWLYGIATNLIRRHWRNESRRLRALASAAATDVGSIDPLLASDDRVDAQRRLGAVLSAVERLEPDERDLLILIAWEGCTSAEAAAALEIPAGTVRSRLKRIRARLDADTSGTGAER